MAVQEQREVFRYPIIEDLPDELRCPICLDILEEPQLTECCGHHFCKKCFDHVHTKGPKPDPNLAIPRKPACPMCNDVVCFKAVFDKNMNRKVGTLKVECPNRQDGCRWKGEVSGMLKHLRSCEFSRQQCPNGCGEEILLTRMDEHLQHCKHNFQTNKLLEDALTKQGYVLMQIVKILMMGIAGAGKTSVKNQLVTGMPPVFCGRCSTMLFEAPIRTISRAITKVTKKGTNNASAEWTVVNTDQLFQMIASALLAQGIVMEPDEEIFAVTQSLTDRATSTDEMTPLTSSPGSSVDQPSSHDSSLESTSQQQVSHSRSKHHLLELLRQSQASDELMKVEWVHIIDTGGQPQFRELLPSVVHNMSMIMHVLRLSEHFTKHPAIEFYEEGKQCCKPIESAHTNEQILQQTVRSMLLRLPVDTTGDEGEMETKERRPKIMVVGTHRDLESKCSETRASKNSQIMKLLSPFIDDVIFCNGLENVVFAMNAVNPSDDDRKVIGKIHSKVAQLFKVGSKHKVPVGWFLLEEDIRKFAIDHNRDLVSLKDCQTIAKSLTISFEALRAALSYFHQLNVFLYYPSLLPDVVFCDPQVPLNFISMLVSFSYKLRSGGPLEDVLEGRWFRFRDQGIVTVGMLEHERFKMCFIPGLFSPTELIQLLQYLFIATPLGSSTVFIATPLGSFEAHSSTALSSSEEFFIPCLLPTLSPAEINHQAQLFPPGSPHLLFVFPSGCTPHGVFSSLIIRLRSNYNYWKISPTNLFSNYIEFQLLHAPMTATVIDSFNFIEIRVQFLGSSTDASNYEHVFPQIRLAITESIEGAVTSLRFVECTPVATFLCGEMGQQCSNSIPHAAQILADGKYWKCTEDPRNIICKPLSEDQLLWLKDPVTDSTKSAIPSSIHDSTADTLLDSQHFLDITDYIQELEKTDLYNLGLVLGLRRQRITDLQEKRSQEFCDSIVDYWLQKVDNVETINMIPSWRNLVTALKHPRLGQTGLADRIAKERNVLI